MSQNSEKDLLREFEKLGPQSKKLRHLLDDGGGDVFATADLIKSLEVQLHNISAAQHSLRDLSKIFDGRCVRARAEFWGSLKEACIARSWGLAGTTDRRIVEQGLFVELLKDKVRVDELALDVSPDAHVVVEAIGKHVEDLRFWTGRIDQFMAALELAYEMVPGERERPLEAIYRATFLSIQRASFWKSLQVSQMTMLVRPIFRACLSAAMSSGVKTPKGRALRFGATLQGKEVWEVFSPGEQRVVQVGRLRLE